MPFLCAITNILTTNKLFAAIIANHPKEPRVWLTRTNTPLGFHDHEKYHFIVQIWPSISLPVNVCYKAGTGWQIHTTMAPMLCCGTAATCHLGSNITVTQRFHIAPTYLQVPIILSFKAALRPGTVYKPGNALVLLLLTSEEAELGSK